MGGGGLAAPLGTIPVLRVSWSALGSVLRSSHAHRMRVLLSTATGGYTGDHESVNDRRYQSKIHFFFSAFSRYRLMIHWYKNILFFSPCSCPVRVIDFILEYRNIRKPAVFITRKYGRRLKKPMWPRVAGYT